MNYFLFILVNNIVPISILIAIGIVMYKAFQIDIRTLSKLNFYVFTPVLVFVKLYESNMTLDSLLKVLQFFIIFFALLCLLVEVVIRYRKYKRSGMPSAMRNSVIFYNSGNYAIPLNQTVFAGDSYTLSIQLVIMILQNVIPSTYGIYAVNAHKVHWKDSIKIIFSMPTIYAIPLAVLLRGFHVPIPVSISLPLHYVADAFMATALMTLGVQLAAMKWRLQLSDVMISNFLRLLIAPAIGVLVVYLLGIKGLTAQALVLSCALPTSLSSVLLAVEYDNEAEFSSQAVFASTLFSLITIPLTILFLMQFYS
jgi:predicted permease